MKKNIPFNKHFGTENEIKYIKNSIKSGHISGRGPFTHKSEKLLKNKIPNSKKILGLINEYFLYGIKLYPIVPISSN